MHRIISSIISFVMVGCSSMHRVNGWYPVADIPENKIEGKAFVTTKDFAVVSLDTVSFSDMGSLRVDLKQRRFRNGLTSRKAESANE